MHIFEKNYKINFVDVNNVLVGFDYSASCCEQFDWVLSHDIIHTDISQQQQIVVDKPILENYVFDKAFFLQFHPWDTKYGYSNDCELVVFRLLYDKQPPLFLHLYNIHNGYYAHGFTFQDGDKIIKEGSI